MPEAEMESYPPIVRIYEDPGRISGDFRVLVDRLWPRGISKPSADLDEWAKDLAPSTELRKWYGHRPDRFSEFRNRYLGELDSFESDKTLRDLLGRSVGKRMVLLTATKDLSISSAQVLRDRIGITVRP